MIIECLDYWPSCYTCYQPYDYGIIGNNFVSMCKCGVHCSNLQNDTIEVPHLWKAHPKTNQEFKDYMNGMLQKLGDIIQKVKSEGDTNGNI